jgi:predicted flavoprotein YhiN
MARIGTERKCGKMQKNVLNPENKKRAKNAEHCRKCALHSPLLLSKEAKALRIPLTGPRPIAEAISSAGGVSFAELDDELMLQRLPGLFMAGEMLDWEAPTGGYLLQGCFATGTRAAKGVIGYLSRRARD